VKQLNLRATRVSAGFQEPFPFTAAVVRAMKEVEVARGQHAFLELHSNL